MELEERLNYQFKDPALLERVLTHRSYRFETTAVEVDNQRLEFLGDAVLDLLAAEKLFQEHPEAREGQLSKLRSRYTSDVELAKVAKTIQLGDYLKLGRGEAKSGGQIRLSNLADALEALFGAIFLDRGLDPARTLFLQLFETHAEWVQETMEDTNPKGKLLEYSQQHWKKTPTYKLIDESGPAHKKSFTTEVSIPSGQTAEGTGSSKREAEASAARELLDCLADPATEQSDLE